MISWPWTSKSQHNKELDRAYRNSQLVLEAEVKKLQEEYHERWEPLLQKAIQLKPRLNAQRDSFVLHIGIDRYMVEMVASHNDEHVWEYFVEEVAVHLKRQLLSLNFSGLYRLARETEHRYPTQLWRGPDNIPPI
jgi:hypothetical protein